MEQKEIPEPKSKKMLEIGYKATIGIAKESINTAKIIHKRLEKLNRQRAYNDAQRHAQEVKDMRYIRLIELRRHAGFGVNTTGLTLLDAIWEHKENKIKKGIEETPTNFSLFVLDATRKKKTLLDKIMRKKDE